ncbi:hypothetical protein ATI61_10993 [Archangium gephyra]|uniref:Uncharacterized protein n=1 Tax=Archangium gephyra TaxID=48 RepID=A0AAC8TCT2_9BACT|nr:hypothetical protein [Archangium gephyra]AKI99715.1 Hypothetical protein AA314_01342 [Archangium gephyra]REG27756.1 hypothetical protein ATI61_10993 [Archangium gephyra]
MPKGAVISFDLKPQGSEDYKTAYSILGNAGFTVTTPNMTIFLPNTTVVGTIPDDWTAERLRDAVIFEFRNAGLNLTSILCGVITDWAVLGDRVDYKTLAR